MKHPWHVTTALLLVTLGAELMYVALSISGAVLPKVGRPLFFLSVCAIACDMAARRLDRR